MDLQKVLEDKQNTIDGLFDLVKKWEYLYNMSVAWHKDIEVQVSEKQNELNRLIEINETLKRHNYELVRKINNLDDKCICHDIETEDDGKVDEMLLDRFGEKGTY